MKKLKIVFVLVFFAFIGLVLLTLAARTIQLPDKYCITPHVSLTKKPTTIKTAQDYFLLGNYEYDLGHCSSAIDYYTKSLEINPNFAEVYNNRAYTYMRMRNYNDALVDLDKAILWNSNYVNAIMNRADIYNFYYNIDHKRAIEEYNRVMELVKDSKERQKISLCGHRLLAKDGGWTPFVYLQIIFQGLDAGCK